MAKLKVAVIGTGALGSIHAKIYSELEGIQLAGICDIDTNKLSLLSKGFGVAGFKDYRQFLGKVDAASIVVPTKDHFRISKDFLEAGTHLLIEKPITQTVEEADQLAKRCTRGHRSHAAPHSRVALDRSPRSFVSSVFTTWPHIATHIQNLQNRARHGQTQPCIATHITWVMATPGWLVQPRG